MPEPGLGPRVAVIMSSLHQLHVKQHHDLKTCLADMQAQQLATHQMCADAVLQRHQEMSLSAELKINELCEMLSVRHQQGRSEFAIEPEDLPLADTTSEREGGASRTLASRALHSMTSTPSRHTRSDSSEPSPFNKSASCGSLESTEALSSEYVSHHKDTEFPGRESDSLQLESRLSRARIRESYNEAQLRQIKNRSGEHFSDHRPRHNSPHNSVSATLNTPLKFCFEEDQAQFTAASKKVQAMVGVVRTPPATDLRGTTHDVGSGAGWGLV